MTLTPRTSPFIIGVHDSMLFAPSCLCCSGRTAAVIAGMNSHQSVQQLLEEAVLRRRFYAAEEAVFRTPFYAAAAGKTLHSGGLNIPEIKVFIESKKDLFDPIDGPIKKSFPDMNMSRAELNNVLTEILAAMAILNSTIHDASEHDEHELVETFLTADPSLLNSRDKE